MAELLERSGAPPATSAVRAATRATVNKALTGCSVPAGVGLAARPARAGTSLVRLPDFRPSHTEETV